jgi:prepilin peptidase CpaA
VVVAVVALSGTCIAVFDLRTRRIPNVATLAVAGAGLGLSLAGASGHSVPAALAGLVLGFLLMLPGHLFGKTGAGDVKLFAAMGTLVGPSHILRAFVFTAIAGGILAVAVAVMRGRLQQTLARTGTLVASGGANAAAIKAPSENNRFPYAPAIAVGCVIAALGL